MTTAGKVQFGLGILLIAAAGTVLFLQHQTLARLRDDNAALRQQLSEAEQLGTENERLSNLVANANSEADKQKSELQKLRGEVVTLRRQTNDLNRVRQDNERLQTALTQPRSSSNSSDDGERQPTDEERMALYPKVNDAKSLMLGAILHASQHGERLPDDVSQLTPYLSQMPGLSGSNSFEIVYHGSLSDFTNSEKTTQTIILRETQPFQLSNGKWGRAYGFADGHAELHTEPENNFDRFEKEHGLTPAGNGQ